MGIPAFFTKRLAAVAVVAALSTGSTLAAMAEPVEPAPVNTESSVPADPGSVVVPEIETTVDPSEPLELPVESDTAPTETAEPRVMTRSSQTARTAAVARDAVTVFTPRPRSVGLAADVYGKFDTSSRITVWGEAKDPSTGTWRATTSYSTTADGSYTIPMNLFADRVGTVTWRVVGKHADGTQQTSREFSYTRLYPAATVFTPRPVPAGANANITGKFSTNASMKVWGEVWRADLGRWSAAPAVYTSATGEYSIPMNFNKDSAVTIRWRVVGIHTDGTRESTREFTYTRTRPAPTVFTPSARPIGEKVYATGSFTTSSAISVWAEVWRTDVGRWSRTPSVTTSSTGAYRVPLDYGSATVGTLRWRIAGQHTDGTIQRSREFTYTRKAPTLNVDRRCLTGRVLCASKTTNKMHWMINGRILETVDVRYGRPGYETREGQFEVFWKSRNHVSSLYGSAMPFSMFFSGGQAVHYSSDFARRGWVGGSAGCINVRDYNTLERIYDQVRVGDKVVVYW